MTEKEKLEKLKSSVEHEYKTARVFQCFNLINRKTELKLLKMLMPKQKFLRYLQDCSLEEYLEAKEACGHNYYKEKKLPKADRMDVEQKYGFLWCTFLAILSAIPFCGVFCLISLLIKNLC